MSTQISESEFAAFRTLLAELCGITVAENKAYLIESRLGSLLSAAKTRSFKDLHARLR